MKKKDKRRIFWSEIYPDLMIIGIFLVITIWAFVIALFSSL